MKYNNITITGFTKQRVCCYHEIHPIIPQRSLGCLNFEFRGVLAKWEFFLRDMQNLLDIRRM
eukprot:TRINITY_DN3540_c0_g1_i1.p2 TRINITY_DN3540_c0_g1~~TRINITY_DN3540_c0_g1_i1.p2  ORF type:complete len:62 (-),score=2.75 TRINITY_DN3540_c0_g1_i1:330-515(-)